MVPYFRKMISIFICTFLIFTSPNRLRASTEQKVKCTREALESKRAGEFKNFLKKRNYSSAGKVLRDYIKETDCYSELVWPAVENSIHQKPIDFRALKSYLWAQSDLIYADLKSGNTTECILRSQSELEGFYHNMIDLANDSKIKDAYKSNLKECQTKRLVGLKAIVPTDCEFQLGNVSLEIRGPEEGDALKFH